jgi:hypothetical protein
MVCRRSGNAKMNHGLELVGVYRPRGEYTLVGAVELIRSALARCCDQGVARLLINGMGLTGVPIPSLVDRFLMAEEWANEAGGMVAMALVVHPKYIHPQRFGVHVAAHFGMKVDVFPSETEGFAWISTLTDSD